MTGCNFTAKSTVDLTYLAIAEKAGAEIYAESEVVHLYRYLLAGAEAGAATPAPWTAELTAPETTFLRERTTDVVGPLTYDGDSAARVTATGPDGVQLLDPVEEQEPEVPEGRRRGVGSGLGGGSEHVHQPHRSARASPRSKCQVWGSAGMASSPVP